MDQKRITSVHLHYLVALVSERHVTRAAVRMGIGQPAMSTALALLRQTFQDPILVKTSAGMVPTPRAMELARRAQDAIELLSGARSADEPFVPGESESHFRIMASDGVAASVVPQLVRRMRKAAPGMQLTVAAGDNRRTAEYLRNGEFDVVLGFFDKPAGDLRQSGLYPQRLVGIAGRRHPTIKQAAVTMEQFIDATHVVWGAQPVPYPTFEVLVDAALSKLGMMRKVALHLPSVRLTAEIVSLSDLVAVVPERLLIGAAKALQVFELPFSVPKVEVSMLWHERMQHAGAHAWLRAQLRDIGDALRRKEGAVQDGR